MLRNRNSFFQESSYAQQYNVPVMTPYYSSGSQQSYFGPYPNMQNNFEDYESRLSRIERQINRLDARISKLENKQIESIDNTTNMYML